MPPPADSIWSPHTLLSSFDCVELYRHLANGTESEKEQTGGRTDGQIVAPLDLCLPTLRLGHGV